MATSNSGIEGPTPTLGTWLLQQYKKWFVILPSLASVAALGTLISTATSLLQSPWFRHILFLSQAILCCLLLILIPPTRADARISERAAKATEQFLEAWKRLWLFWIMLYMIFFCREMFSSFLADQLVPCEKLIASIPSNVNVTGSIGDVENCRWVLSLWKGLGGWALNVANNFQTLSLIMLYLVITKSTVDPKQKDSKLPWTAGIGVLVVITMIHLVMVFGSAWQKHVVISPEAFEWGRKIFMWSSGLFAGIAMALVVGRFNSKNIDPPTWTVTLFYIYALIQVPWGAFEESTVLEPIIVLAALLLKCLLFLFVSWLLETGILFFFVDRVAFLIKNSRKARDDYLKQLKAADEAQEVEDLITGDN